MELIRLVMADDHNVVRKAVISLLNQEPDIEVIGEVNDNSHLLEVVERLKPDILLLDANMPGPNIVELAQEIRTRYVKTHIVVLSAFDRGEHVIGLLRAGVSGYVLKDDDPDSLIEAIHLVASEEEYISPRVSRVLLKAIRNDQKRHLTKLTSREHDVLRLISQGSSNEDIAKKLMISIYTVKNHVRNIFRKLDVQTRVEAAVAAINKGFVDS